MSKLIIDLLSAKENLFERAVDDLEKASGNKGEDVRLTAELIETFNSKIP